MYIYMDEILEKVKVGSINKIEVGGIKDVKQWNDFLKGFLGEISRYHPKYPLFGYAWDGEKVVECKLY